MYNYVLFSFLKALVPFLTQNEEQHYIFSSFESTSSDKINPCNANGRAGGVWTVLKFS